MVLVGGIGGFDGVDITKKNPFSNVTLTGGSTNDGQSNYAWYSVFTAIKALKDPEFIDSLNLFIAE